MKVYDIKAKKFYYDNYLLKHLSITKILINKIINRTQEFIKG